MFGLYCNSYPRFKTHNDHVDISRTLPSWPFGGPSTLGENEMKFLIRLKIWGKSYILKNV